MKGDKGSLIIIIVLLIIFIPLTIIGYFNHTKKELIQVIYYTMIIRYGFMIIIN